MEAKVACLRDEVNASNLQTGKLRALVEKDLAQGPPLALSLN